MAKDLATSSGKQRRHQGSGKVVTKGLVINYGEGGLQNGGSKTFCAPPPQDRVKPFVPPPLLKSGTPTPPTIWLKLQATA